MKKVEEKESTLPSLALVFGYIAIRELQSNRDRITILYRLGYGNAQIAQICGVTQTYVRKEIRLAKNKKGGKGK